MTTSQQLSELMAKIGPACGLLEVTEFDEGSNCSWILVAEEETYLTADLDEAFGKLVLACEIATPPAERRGDIYEMLLRFQNAWPDTGGLRFSVDVDDSVVMMFDLAVSHLNVELLQTVVANFLRQAAHWREIISAGVDIEPVDSTPDIDNTGMVRV